MKIGIDYRLANRSYRGMARYCREIVRMMLETDNENEYFLILDSAPNIKIPEKAKVKFVKISTHNYIIGEQVCIPRLLNRLNLEVFWSPYNTFPIRMPHKTRLLVTVHDLIFFYRIDKRISLYQRIGALYRRFILKYFKKKVSSFFTVSEFSKKEMLRLLQIDVPIEVTYNCVDKFASKVNMVKSIAPDIYDEDYFFTVSGDGPNKNIDNVLTVFEKDFPNEKIVVAGLSSTSKHRNRKRNNIKFLPYGISDEELIKAYLKCKCFLFCSKYEGFGIPIIEASICRKPIIASNTTSIPEILNGQGITGNPTRESIRNMIREFLVHPEKGEVNYVELVRRFNNWEVPAKLILNRIMNY